MALTLYVETNFPIGIAKGQDPEAAEFLESDSLDVQIAIPGVCVMEAFSVWEFEEKQKKKLEEQLSSQIREVGRNTTSPRAQRLVGYLELSKVESADLFSDTEDRLYEALARLAEDAEMIDVNFDILIDSLANKYINDPTDNLILCCILWHAHHNPVGHKAFFSHNHRDFDQPVAREVLAAAGVNYFSRVDAALGWLRSRPASDAEE